MSGNGKAQAFRGTSFFPTVLRSAFLGTSVEGASLTVWILKVFCLLKLVEVESNFH